MKYPKLHIMWETEKPGGPISEFRIIAQGEIDTINDLMPEHWKLTYWAISNGRDEANTPGFDDTTDKKIRRLGLRGFLLGLIVEYQGITPGAAKQLREALDRQGIPMQLGIEWDAPVKEARRKDRT
jgi:hypothetical protein